MKKSIPLLVVFILSIQILFALDTLNMAAKWNEKLPGSYTFYSPLQIIGHEKETLITGGLTGRIVVHEDTLISGKIRSGFLGVRDSIGDWQWAKRIEGAGYNQINSSLSLNDGWLVAGVFSDTIRPGGFELIAEKHQNIFLCKIDNSGDYLWAKTIDIAPVGGKQFLTPAGDDNIFFATEFTGEFAFGDSLYNSSGNRSVLIARLNPAGEFADVKIIESGSSLSLDVAEPVPGGRLMVGINFKDTVFVGNQSLVNAGVEDFLIATIKNDLQLQWLKHTEGRGKKNISGAKRHQGGVVLYGEYNGSFIWEDQSFPEGNGSHIFLMKLQGNGNFNWKYSLKGNSDKNAGDLIIGDHHQVYVWGNYRGQLSHIDQEHETEGLNHQWFVAGFSADGNPQWLVHAENPYKLKARLKTGNKPGLLHLIGYNQQEGQELFGHSFNANGQGLYFMDLFDCNYARKPALPADTIFCGSGTLDGGDGYTGYSWNGNGQGRFFEVSQTGMVYLEATDKYGCIVKDSVFVEVLPDFTISIMGNDSICPGGGSNMLMVDAAADITWSTGETGSIVFVDEPGHYYAEAINQDGCIAEDFITISEYEITLPELAEYYMIEPDGSLELYPGHYASYLWTGGIEDSLLFINGSDFEEGSYDFILEATDFNQCQITHEFIVDILYATTQSGDEDPDSGWESQLLDPLISTESFNCDFQIYPNPGSGPFYLAVNAHDHKQGMDNGPVEMELIIWGMQGEMILWEKIPPYTHPYKIWEKSLNPGKYLVSLIMDNEICRIKKLIVLP